MVTLEQIRTVAMDLPGVTESLHFRLPTFKIGNSGFITVQKDAAIMALPEKLSNELSSHEPGKFELTYRNKMYFIGIKVNLQQSDIEDLKPLIIEAYQHKRQQKK
jgi:hypothetical protein